MKLSSIELILGRDYNVGRDEITEDAREIVRAVRDINDKKKIANLELVFLYNGYFQGQRFEKD